MPSPRKFSPEIEQQILEEFFSDLTNAQVGKKYGCDYNRTIKARWLLAYGEQALHDRYCDNCAISKLGTKNPMYGKAAKLHPRWKPESYDNSGYRLVDAPRWFTGTKHKGNKVLEHILVACEAARLRELPPYHIVHHINHRKRDNRPENLEIISRNLHAKLHKPRTGKFKQRATTIPKGSRKATKASEAHSAPQGR